MNEAETHGIARVKNAIAAIRKGGMVVLTDDGDRENEGDLVMAAQKVSPAAINFMIREARGLVCLSLTSERVAQLQLPLMVAENTSRLETAFTVSVEAAKGVTTGISAADRARTIKAAIAPRALPKDLTRPGHIFPLRARDGGVLARPGHTEGSVDLARAAGQAPAGVICEVINNDGTMARQTDLKRFARRHGFPMLSISDLVTWRLSNEVLVRRIGEVPINRPPYGSFRAVAYASDFTSPGALHIALLRGNVKTGGPVLTRIHRQTLLGDLLDTCTGNGDLKIAFEQIARAERGLIIFLQRHLGEAQALELAAPPNIQALRDQEGQSRLREFGIGAQILADLGVRELNLLTNTRTKIVGVERYGIVVASQIRLESARQPRAIALRKG